jgi:hypothetical protein
MSAVTRGFAAVWHAWKVGAAKIADVQARAVLSLFYFVVLGPFALPLRVRRVAGGGWQERPLPGGDPVMHARRQF